MNMGLNCVGSLTRGFFPIVNTIVLHDLWVVKPTDADHRYRGTTNMEGRLQVIGRFSTVWRDDIPNPLVVQGSTIYLFPSFNF